MKKKYLFRIISECRARAIMKQPMMVLTRNTAKKSLLIIKVGCFLLMGIITDFLESAKTKTGLKWYLLCTLIVNGLIGAHVYLKKAKV